MRTILVTSPYIPHEWIEAHGFKPRRSVPSSEARDGDASPSQGMCHFMWRSVLETHQDGDAAATVFTTICDQMRRAPDYCRRSQKPVFLLHVPKTWREKTSFDFYVSELQRLGDFLSQIGGRAPTEEELIGIMHSSEMKRQSILDFRGRLTARQFSEMLCQFHIEGTVTPLSSPPNSKEHAIPLALVGGPLAWNNYALFDEVERAGGSIVIDGTENGERTLPSPFDPAQMMKAPLRELARAYFEGIPDIFRRPNDAFFEWLKNVISSHSVQGIILHRQVWCDLWHAEVHRIRETFRVPVLDIDSDGRKILDRNRNRIEAFMELLR